MLKKLRRRVKIIATKPFTKKHRRKPPSPPSPPPPQSSLPSSSSPSPTMSPLQRRHHEPYLFPRAQSSVLPDPSAFFSPRLLNRPLPTNSFFQNYVLKKGDQPEYIHPYLIRSQGSKLTICYPNKFKNPNFIYQIFTEDLAVSATHNPSPNSPHIVSSFSDLSVTLDFPSSSLRFFLVRGSPFLTCSVENSIPLSISTIHAVLELNPNSSCTKYSIKLNNNQLWVLYASSPIKLSVDGLNCINSEAFCGIIRITALPDCNKGLEGFLDRFSSCYPVEGRASFDRPYCVEYKWEKRGWGDLLMLAHPLHLKLLSTDESSVTVLHDLKYDSIDGELVAVVGDSWVLKTDPISVTWHSVNGVNEDSYAEITEALVRDVEALDSSTVTTSSSYFYGKLIARAARLALIAEEVSHLEAIPKVTKFLKETIEPWLEGTFGPNGFLYDPKWGGLVTKQGSQDSGADFGFGIYNDHHYHLGYFVYAISVLAKIDPSWGRKFRAKSYALVADYMNLSTREDSDYTSLRCFDSWKLHSWAGGLTEFADGRNQESTSEAVNAYYSASLMGLAYGDSHLVSIGSTVAAFEIEAARTWWHVKEAEGGSLYPEEFVRENRVVGVLWASKRDGGLWFAPASWRETRLGIQLLPVSPISEALFGDVGFARELVEWALPALAREGVGEGWKGFVYALQGIYDGDGALEGVRRLNGYDDGNSLTNLLWWVWSRGGGGGGDGGEEFRRGRKFSWFRHYCH